VVDAPAVWWYHISDETNTQNQKKGTNDMSYTEQQLRQAEEISNAQRLLSEYIPCAARLSLYEDSQADQDFFPAVRYYLREDTRRAMVEIWRSKIKLIEKMIRQIPSMEMQLILEYRYIRGLSLDHIFDTLRIERTKGFRLYKKALLAVASQMGPLEFRTDAQIASEACAAENAAIAKTDALPKNNMQHPHVLPQENNIIKEVI
jgi:DNA-directed RNA polymerase specialized sigma subunit